MCNIAYSIVPEHIDSSNFLDISFRVAVYWCPNNNLIIAERREREEGEREKERKRERERESTCSDLETVDKQRSITYPSPFKSAAANE